MSVTFTKLFSSITESTVWCEPDRTRLAWITMLAMADSRGRVWGSVPGLANRARIPVDDMRVAIMTFLEPDADSRSKECDGRRIEEIDGGWRLINYEKYRSIRDEESIKESKRKYINARREKERLLSGVENVDRSRHNAEAEAEAEVKRSKALSGKPDPAPSGLRKVNGNAQFIPDAQSVMEYLNKNAGKGFEFKNRVGGLTASAERIIARLKQGYTAMELREVVFAKCAQWKDDEKMAEYLRPATLFSKENFEQYLGEIKGGGNG